MHLCAFFFAVNGVQNEYEKSSFGFFKKIKMLNEVVKDPVIRNAIKYVDPSKLNNYYRMVYKGIEGGSGYTVFFSHFKTKFYDNIYKPLARKLINGKITGLLFKKLK